MQMLSDFFIEVFTEIEHLEGRIFFPFSVTSLVQTNHLKDSSEKVEKEKIYNLHWHRSVFWDFPVGFYILQFLY